MSIKSLTIRQSTLFKRDVKRLLKQRADLTKLEKVVEELLTQKPLDPKYHDHPLSGIWKSYRDCHIQPDWLLIYRIQDNELQLARTGSHAELFE